MTLSLISSLKDPDEDRANVQIVTGEEDGWTQILGRKEDFGSSKIVFSKFKSFARGTPWGSMCLLEIFPKFLQLHRL